jgi:hypothetical protein
MCLSFHELIAGYYSGFAYAMAQLAVEIPYIIAQSILFSLLVRPSSLTL